MTTLDLARLAIANIRNLVPDATLNRTTYCAMVIQLNNGNCAVLVAEAGASVRGVNGPLISDLERILSTPVIGCADPIPGLGTWHMNDAEQQALKIWNKGYKDCSTLKAVVATRPICASCTHTLTQLGLQVNGAEAS